MRTIHRPRAVSIVLTAVLLALACDSKSPQEPPPTPTITVSAGAQAVEVLQGGAATVSVNITRGGGYTGPVTIAAENVPAGVTVSGATIAAGQTSATLNISAQPSAAAATTNVTIRATGTGVSAQTTAFALTVREPPGYTLAVAPSPLSVVAGASATATATLTRTGGFTQAVALTADAPAGLTVGFAPASVTTNQSTITVTAAASMAAGTYAVTIRGAAAGLAERTATLTVSVGAAPSIAIVLNPTTLSLAQGQSGTTAVTLTRGGGYTGAVTVTAEGLPAGVTIAPATLATGATAATLNVVTTAAAPTGSHTITLRATGTGVTAATATLTLQVTAPASIQVALNPTSVQVQQGASSTVAVTVTRAGGFTDAVTISAENLPAGVSIANATIPAGSTTANLTVVATAGAALGTSAATIRATGTGVTAVTAPLSIQVTPGGSPGGNVTYQFCPDSGLPLWVAAQDGTGAWTRLTGNANNQYSFQITTRGALAYVLPDGTGYDLDVFYGTLAELQLMGSELCSAGTGSTRTITGTVAGLSATEAAWIGLGDETAFVMAALSTSFTLENVQPGVVDLLGARFDIGSGGFVLNRLFLQRNLNPPNNSAVTVDFNGANAFAPVTHNLTIANLQGDAASRIGFYRTATGSMAPFDIGDEFSAATQQYRGLPQAVQQPGDVHFFIVTASAPAVPDPTHFRTVMHAFATAGDRTITLGPVLSNVTLQTLASNPYARIRASYPVQSEYALFFSADYSQQAGSRNANVQMSSGYLGGSTTAQLDIPDFTGVAGWNNTWGPQAGTSTEWTFTATGWSGTGNIINPFTDNAIFTAASRTGTFVP